VDTARPQLEVAGMDGYVTANDYTQGCAHAASCELDLARNAMTQNE
jgi:hypothetical protein